MIDLLFPQATLITPNSLEARRLAFGDDADDADEIENTSLEESAQRLLSMGCEYVLITGTHERSTEVVNTLYGEKGLWVRPAAMFNEEVVIDGVRRPRFARETPRSPGPA